jgi:hypothetical protein
MFRKKIEKMIAHFEELGIILYDREYEEVIILDAFYYHPPVGGLTFEMFRKDLAKISSEKIMAALVENSKKYTISIQFFAALKEFIPDILNCDFKIKKTKLTEEEARTVAERGRRNASALKTKSESSGKIKVDLDDEEGDENSEELPF